MTLWAGLHYSSVVDRGNFFSHKSETSESVNSGAQLPHRNRRSPQLVQIAYSAIFSTDLVQCRCVHVELCSGLSGTSTCGDRESVRRRSGIADRPPCSFRVGQPGRTGLIYVKSVQPHHSARSESCGTLSLTKDPMPLIPPVPDIERARSDLRAAAVAVKHAVEKASSLLSILHRTADVEASIVRASDEMDRAVDAEASAFDRLNALQGKAGA
jgi:hypothetical protein